MNTIANLSRGKSVSAGLAGVSLLAEVFLATTFPLQIFPKWFAVSVRNTFSFPVGVGLQTVGVLVIPAILLSSETRDTTLPLRGGNVTFTS
ncbi:unnamed protein product [Allacma fusca]|uniref:Uncharacterized protein n=1 Tax=Allacma fusca TaxID=39272 RepID=A0A8J2PJ13_9HEXA|nr:unnamed protein product [Allacma fusca]